MKTFIVVVFCLFSMNSIASTENPDGGVTLTQKEWTDLKSTLVVMSTTITETTRDKVFSDNRLATATSEIDVLRKANVDVMNANITLLQERDALRVSVSAMANCPKSPIPGPTNAMVGWEAPTQRVSNKPILPEEVAGYFLHYGTNKDNLNVRLKLPDRNIREYTINGLAPGTYYFCVSAYDTDGTEGPKSNLVTKIIK